MNLRNLLDVEKKLKESNQRSTTESILVLGDTKLICWSAGSTDPILSKNIKMVLQNFDQLAFFKLLFSAFWKKSNNK